MAGPLSLESEGMAVKTSDHILSVLRWYQECSKPELLEGDWQRIELPGAD